MPDPDDEIKVPKSTYIPSNTPQLWRKGTPVGWLLEDMKTIGYPPAAPPRAVVARGRARPYNKP